MTRSGARRRSRPATVLAACHRHAAARRVPRQPTGLDRSVELVGLVPGGEGAAVLNRMAVPPLDQEVTPRLTRGRRASIRVVIEMPRISTTSEHRLLHVMMNQCQTAGQVRSACAGTSVERLPVTDRLKGRRCRCLRRLPVSRRSSRRGIVRSRGRSPATAGGVSRRARQQANPSPLLSVDPGPCPVRYLSVTSVTTWPSMTADDTG